MGFESIIGRRAFFCKKQKRHLWVSLSTNLLSPRDFGACDNNSKAKLTATTTKLSYARSGLTPGLYYNFKVVAQRKIGGKWVNISRSYDVHFTAGNLSKSKKYTNVKSISVSKTAVTLKAGGTSTIKPEMKVVKKGKGTCKVYVVGVNGVYKALKVTVK